MRYRSTTQQRWVSVVLWFTLLLTAAVSPASAAGDPTATATLSPGAVGGGSTTQLTLTVTPDSGTVFSVALTAPGPGWTLSPAQISHGGLRATKSSPFTLTFQATAPCSFGADEWGLEVRQKNGTLYSIAPLVTTVGAPTQCTASFSPGQPANTARDAVIFADAYAASIGTPSPDPLAVGVFRGDGTLDAGYSQTISLSLGNDPTGSATLGGDVEEAAAGGVAASFTATIDEPSAGYTLRSSVPDVGTSVSNGFAILSGDNVTLCSGGGRSCKLQIPGPEVTTLISTGPSGQAAILGGTTTDNFSCPGQTTVTSSVVAFDYTGDGTIVVSEFLSKQVMNALPQNGIAHVDICLASATPFVEEDGSPAEFDPEIGMYVGLLPPCGGGDTTKCIFTRRKTQSGVGVIEYALSPGDPGRKT